MVVPRGWLRGGSGRWHARSEARSAAADVSAVQSCTVHGPPWSALVVEGAGGALYEGRPPEEEVALGSFLLAAPAAKTAHCCKVKAVEENSNNSAQSMEAPPFCISAFEHV